MAKPGYGAKVMAGTEEVGWVSDWNDDLTRDTVETTHMNDGQGGWKSFIYGLGSGTASITCAWDVNATAKKGQKALQDAFLNAETIVIKEYVDAVSYYQGTFLITNMGVAAEVSGLVQLTFQAQLTGAPTFAAA